MSNVGNYGLIILTQGVVVRGYKEKIYKKEAVWNLGSSLGGKRNLHMESTEILPLCRWLEDHELKTLKYYAIWGSRGDWIGWKLLSPPPHLSLSTIPSHPSYMEFLPQA